MIHPTAADILKTIDATLAAKVVPALENLDGQSAVTTIRHLLRLVLVRTEEEGQTLLDEIGELRKLMPGVRDYLKSIESGAEQSQQIDAALAQATENESCYPTLEMLAERLSTLREALYQALKILQALRRDRQEQPEYRAVRAAIRTYIVWQNEQERRLIAPAFYGQGPRR